jgi:hypothetical protein
MPCFYTSFFSRKEIFMHEKKLEFANISNHLSFFPFLSAIEVSVRDIHFFKKKGPL